jgi:hypothetical protein
MTYAASRKSTQTTVIAAAMMNMSLGRSLCSLYSRYDRHFSKTNATLCVMFSFIRSLSPAAAVNLPAKKRVG